MRYLVCYNPHEALRQSQHRLEVVSQLKVELARHKNQKTTPQWAIDLLASQRTKRYRAWRRTTRHKCYQGCGSTDGKWVIETNDDTLTPPEDAASAYKGLMVIERCFRTLKTTQLKLEPVYHRLSRRIEAHVKICVMALLIERVAELACDQPWSQLRPILARLQATEVHILSHVLFKRNQPTQAVRNLFQTLDIPFPEPILDISELNEAPLNS